MKKLVALAMLLSLCVAFVGCDTKKPAAKPADTTTPPPTDGATPPADTPATPPADAPK